MLKFKVLKNEKVIDSIKDEKLKNEVIIARTTIKYLEGKFIKITSEEELDRIIEKVRTAKVSRQPKTTTISKPKTTVPVSKPKTGGRK